jgi:rubrerythrin
LKEVYSMEGGIAAWNGLVAEGFPEDARTFFAGAASSEEYAALAFYLEEGTRKFYEELSSRFGGQPVALLFKELAAAEVHHQQSLANLYLELSGKAEAAEFPGAVLPDQEGKGWMEGGVPLKQALDWAQGKGSKEILELGISLETNAYDRYLVMRDEVGEERSRRVFGAISEEEKRHLDRLIDHFEKML